MSSNSNSNLIVACNILNRVQAMLQGGNRVQLSNDTLRSISDYLIKCTKYIDPTIKEINTQYIVFTSAAESIHDLLETSGAQMINNDTKEFLVDQLEPTITEFRVNVGRYLADNDFNYSPAMDSVLKGIVDTCLENGYYFGLEVSSYGI